MADKTTDMVNHPAHYNKLTIETIEILEEITPHYPVEIAGHIWNVIKYLFRAPFKNNLKEDLMKAEFYLNRAIERISD